MSGNTAGAVFATDGRVFAPMLPIAPRLVKCRKCKEPIWAPACKILGTASERQWKEIPWPEDAREGDCLKFVDTLSAGDEREKPVRIRAWWARSDMFPRSSKEQVTTWTDAQRANVLRLKNLLDAKDPDDRVMIAEIERQLGNFEACLKLLDFNFPEHLGLRVRKMRELASAKRAQAETVER